MSINFDKLEFLNEHLSYHDAPIEGFVRAEDKQLYAFRTFVIIRDKLWHWLLVPVQSTEISAEAVMDAAIRQPPERWISIIEDLRTETRMAYDAVMVGGVALLP